MCGALGVRLGNCVVWVVALAVSACGVDGWVIGSCFVVWRGVWFRGWLVWWVVDLILRVWCVLGV